MQTVSQNYINIFAMILMACTMAGVITLLSFIVGPRNPNARKSEPYECGIEDIAPMPKRFPVKFLQVAMLFLIFDVEAIALYPAVAVLKEQAALGNGLYILGAVGSFMGVVVIGYAYQWKKGAFEWIS